MIPGTSRHHEDHVSSAATRGVSPPPPGLPPFLQPTPDQPQQADFFASAGSGWNSFMLDENWSILADAPLRTCFPTSMAAVTSPDSASFAWAFSTWYWRHGWQFAVQEAGAGRTACAARHPSHRGRGGPGEGSRHRPGHPLLDGRTVRQLHPPQRRLLVGAGRSGAGDRGRDGGNDARRRDMKAPVLDGSYEGDSLTSVRDPSSRPYFEPFTA